MRNLPKNCHHFKYFIYHAYTYTYVWHMKFPNHVPAEFFSPSPFLISFWSKFAIFSAIDAHLYILMGHAHQATWHNIIRYYGMNFAIHIEYAHARVHIWPSALCVCVTEREKMLFSIFTLPLFDLVSV